MGEQPCSVARALGPESSLARAVVALALSASLCVGCAAVQIGRRFPIDPRHELKVGHDQKADVLRKMGDPLRRFVDSDGREVFTYVWADGDGGGQKCLIAFNKNDTVYLIEVVP